MMLGAAPSRPLRAGAAVASVIALAGCSSVSGTPSAGTGAGEYADGTYTAEGSYATPESVETIEVTLTLHDDIITAVEVTGDPTQRESSEYQGRFIGGIADVVVGRDIDTIAVSRVAGSSLTSGGFNQAVQQIKAEAAG